jgi:nucleoside 2-deoxyribosyltransferase
MRCLGALPCSIDWKSNMKIYLAGPLFNIAERNFNQELTRLLRDKGHQVWLPQEFEQRTLTPGEIFAKDVEGIDWADVVLANMDGPDPDSGTCWECGYAFRKKPVVLFRTDFRAGHKMRGDLPEIAEQNDRPYNLMLTEAATERLDLPYAALDRVAERIDQALANLLSAT